MSVSGMLNAVGCETMIPIKKLTFHLNVFIFAYIWYTISITTRWWLEIKKSTEKMRRKR